MIQGVVDGICRKLNVTFGDGHKVHTEAVKQGLKGPCFLVLLVSPSSVPVVGGRCLRGHLFDIHYFPGSNEPRAECHAVQDELYLALEYVVADGGIVRGTGMRGEFIDGALHFFVSYDFFAMGNAQTEAMKLLEHLQTTMKG